VATLELVSEGDIVIAFVPLEPEKAQPETLKPDVVGSLEVTPYWMLHKTPIPTLENYC
jgi:hypothetical protein